MVEAASLALAESLTADESALELVYPRIERIREISAQIAARVIRESQKKVSDVSLAAMFPPQLKQISFFKIFLGPGPE